MTLTQAPAHCHPCGFHYGTTWEEYRESPPGAEGKEAELHNSDSGEDAAC